MIRYYACVFLMTLMGSCGSLFLKRASTAKGMKEIAGNVNLYTGVFLYAVGAALNIWLLRYLDYSAVLPLTSFTYVWTMALSYLFLKEKITKKKIAGVLLILLGAVFVSM